MQGRTTNTTSRNLIKNLSDLKTVVVSTTTILPDEIASLCLKRKKHFSLKPEKIDVFKGPKYAEKLAEALTDDTVVTHLKLNDCNISDAGLAHLGKLIEVNENITHIDAERNNITDEGLILFAQSLEKNTSLVSLNLHFNCIVNSGAIALAKAIQSHPTLIHINLSSNPLNEEGTLAIVRALKDRGLKKRNNQSVRSCSRQ